MEKERSRGLEQKTWSEGELMNSSTRRKLDEVHRTA